jgi:hypothetical protein
MAGAGFVAVLVLVMVFVPVWELIWGRREPSPDVSLVRDPGPPRLRARHRSEP